MVHSAENFFKQYNQRKFFCYWVQAFIDKAKSKSTVKQSALLSQSSKSAIGYGKSTPLSNITSLENQKMSEGAAFSDKENMTKTLNGGGSRKTDPSR